MKKIFPIIMLIATMAVLVTACNNKSPVNGANGKVITYADTAGLADFQKWKAQNELVNPAVYYQQGNQYASNNHYRSSGVSHRIYRSSTINRSGSVSSTSYYPAKAKRGWSKRAKGSIIGAGAGGVLGAVINKRNRVAGGVVGGLIGAGIGYVIGNEMDRRAGR